MKSFRVIRNDDGSTTIDHDMGTSKGNVQIMAGDNDHVTEVVTSLLVELDHDSITPTEEKHAPEGQPADAV